MILRIKCPKCESENEKDFLIYYIDESGSHLEDSDEWEELNYGRCKRCDEILVWRKE